MLPSRSYLCIASIASNKKMNDNLFPPLVLQYMVFTVCCILIAIPSSYCDDDEQFLTCSRSYNFSCGEFLYVNMSYPFWGGNRSQPCGRRGFELKCQDGPIGPLPKIEYPPQTFKVLSINTTDRTMTMARDDLNISTGCPESFDNISFNQILFNFSSKVRNLSLFYDCYSKSLPGSNNFSCPIENEEETGFYIVDGEMRYFQNLTNTCSRVIKIPVLSGALDLIEQFENGKWLGQALLGGFEVQYQAENRICSECESSGGICGSNESNPVEFVCLCRDKPHPHTCPGSTLNLLLKIGIGLGSVFLGMGLMGTACLLYLRRKNQKNAPSSYVSRSVYSNSSSLADLEKGDTLLGVQLFTYNELEKATNNFDSDKELGDGGFGTVYYGKLEDGRSVAVKRLYESNYKRLEQFMNEVEILARLRHQNLVSLYGCTSRHSRELLLVYDYIPNGTVADHVHGPRAKPGALPWPTRLKIAVETASALTYLHASDVIHRDVKTNNILLDNNFCVKVADFGLSRFFPTNVTHISTAPQGTPGYVDPEYHQCYHLTDKSDVFSFGVVLIELISSKPAVDITRHRHEINLSNMAINKIQNKALHELVDTTLGFGSHYKVTKMINAVAELAFQCLQSEKDMRPCMADVLETLRAIMRDGYEKQKAEEMDIPSDDIGLLQSASLSVSPDSVTFRWNSTRTTPSTSS